jgi:hypothetical protein
LAALPCHDVFALLHPPPGSQDTSDDAHIHNPAVSGKQLVSEHHLGLPSHDGMLTTAGRGLPLALATAAAAAAPAAASGDEGIVDLEAYTDYAGASSSTSSSGLLEGHGPADQQQQQGATKDNDAALQQAEGGADDVQISEQLRAGWMTSDLSVLLAGNYRAYMEAVRM